MRIKNNKRLIKLILKKSREICKSLKKRKKRKRGRPPLYEDHIIVSALLIKTLKGLSLRDLQEELHSLFPKVPNFTTLCYRFKKLNQDCLILLIRQTAEEIKEKLGATEFHCLIADGTGFGYGEPYQLRLRKGRELREVKSHVKTEVLVGVVKGKTPVVEVNTGRPYADENRLLMQMLEGMEVRARYFVGDAYYGKSVKVLKKVKELNMIAIVPVKDTVHTRVRDVYRQWARRSYEDRREVYRRNRFRVEQVIGIVKNVMGDRDWTKDFYVASLYVLGRFAIYNLALLEELLLLLFRLSVLVRLFKALSLNIMGIFPTASRRRPVSLPLRKGT